MGGIQRVLARKFARLVLVVGLVAGAACAAVTYDSAGADDATATSGKDGGCGVGHAGDEWRRYDDPFGRFSFAYPVDWPQPVLPIAPDEAVSIFSYAADDPACVPGDTWSPGMAKIEVLPVEGDVAVPEASEQGALDGAAAHAEVWRADAGSSTEVDEAAAADLAASGLQVYAATYAEHHDRTYVIAFYSGGDPDQGLDLYRQVLASWRWNTAT